MIAETEIEKAVNAFVAGYFSWDEMADDVEVACVQDGFHAGVHWALNQCAK